MTLVTVVFVLIVLGFVMYLLGGYIPAPISKIIYFLVAIAVCVWLLQALGIAGPTLRIK